MEEEYFMFYTVFYVLHCITHGHSGTGGGGGGGARGAKACFNRPNSRYQM